MINQKGIETAAAIAELVVIRERKDEELEQTYLLLANARQDLESLRSQIKEATTKNRLQEQTINTTTEEVHRLRTVLAETEGKRAALEQALAESKSNNETVARLKRQH